MTGNPKGLPPQFPIFMERGKTNVKKNDSVVGARVGFAAYWLRVVGDAYNTTDGHADFAGADRDAAKQ
jgi:hypothetical protein